LHGPSSQSSRTQIKRLQKDKRYRITKAIAKSTDQFITGRYEGPLDRGTPQKQAPPLPELKDIREDARQKGTDKLTLAQINREVAAVRRQDKKKLPKAK
jgi:hypothetical protein